MKKFILMAALLLCGCFTVMAQKRVVTGIVKDEYSIPMIGVTVLIQGTNNGTQTDISGHYSIECENKDTLVFSYLGAITQYIFVGAKQRIDVVLIYERHRYVSQEEVSDKLEVSLPMPDIDSDSTFEM